MVVFVSVLEFSFCCRSCKHDGALRGLSVDGGGTARNSGQRTFILRVPHIPRAVRDSRDLPVVRDISDTRDVHLLRDPGRVSRNLPGGSGVTATELVTPS